jgi:hypothetical protein
MADTTTNNRMKSVVEQVIDQLRSAINGSTGYNNRLVHNQIVLGSRAISEQSKFPFICVPTASWDVSQKTIGGANFIVDFEIEIQGFTKDADEALQKAFDLGSDIEKALRADPSLGSEGIYGFGLSPCEAVSQDEFGGVLFVLTGKFPITIT